MLPAFVITQKRDGIELSSETIHDFISGFTQGSIPDYQMAALAMAIYFRGLSDQETADLTDAMLNSGTRLPRRGGKIRVDKHSTGGLGDKTSLVIAPLLACCDLDVPKLSGRGLGITGGTLDKLESIPGYRTRLDTEQMNSMLEKCGCFIAGTTENIAPADKKLYALRDVTGTVPSAGLISASIMSKKLAENLDALVLDVKYGSGAFMETYKKAQELARLLVVTGERMQVATTALLSDMDQPLGEAIGNSVEILEAVDVLRGEGPADTRELSLRLAAEILCSIKIANTSDEAVERLANLLDSGKAFERFQHMVRLQGGSDDFRSLPVGQPVDVASKASGYLSALDGQLIGRAIVELGGGRKQIDCAIDHRIGLRLLRKRGDFVERGESIATLYIGDRSPELALELLSQAFVISEQEPAQHPLWRKFTYES